MSITDDKSHIKRLMDATNHEALLKRGKKQLERDPEQAKEIALTD